MIVKLNFQLKTSVRLTRVATADASLRRTDQLIVIVTMDTKDNSVTVIEFYHDLSPQEWQYCQLRFGHAIQNFN